MPERGRGGARLSPDARRILIAQGLRAFVYGLGSVLIGVSLARQGLSGIEVGVLLAALLAGAALVSIALARYADRVGRRRCYRVLLAGMAVAGTAFAVTDWLPALMLAALTGTVSTEVVESGPFTSLEQAMLPSTVDPNDTARIFGTYNTIATLAGSLGALAAGVPALLDVAPQRLLLAYPVAVALALVAIRGLSRTVEAEGAREHGAAEPSLRRSQRIVGRLLFALDSLGGGFVTQAFIAYVFTRKYGARPETLGAVFFAIGILQAVSFQAAVRLAHRIGLLRTMVFTHLPSNLLLAAIALAPTLAAAIALLLARSLLSQMDVPTRQAYVVAVVDPSERTPAAAYTNTARYVVRPFAPPLAGAALQVALGAPFVIAGILKRAYDIGLYALFRKVAVDER